MVEAASFVTALPLVQLAQGLGATAGPQRSRNSWKSTEGDGHSFFLVRRGARTSSQVVPWATQLLRHLGRQSLAVYAALIYSRDAADRGGTTLEQVVRDLAARHGLAADGGEFVRVDEGVSG